MLVKVISFLALMAFVSLPFAQSLECYICSDITCKNPATVTCDQLYTNITVGLMQMYYDGVKEVNSTDYSCVISEYKHNNDTALNIRGCVAAGTFDCGLKIKEQQWTKKVCKVCNKDKCNVPNSVARYSSSYAVILPLLVVIKIFFV